MRVRLVVVLGLFCLGMLSQRVAGLTHSTAQDKRENLTRAVVLAIDLEAHADGLENSPELCIGLGNGLTLDEDEILSRLQARSLKVHPNKWCNDGPRGVVLSIVAPIREIASGTYELTIQEGDLRPIERSSQHFATLVRKGICTVKSISGQKPELVRYQETTPVSP